MSKKVNKNEIVKIIKQREQVDAIVRRIKTDEKMTVIIKEKLNELISRNKKSISSAFVSVTKH